VRYGPGRSLIVGLEHRTNPREYDWNGLTRGGDAASPFVIMQYTLNGWGIYEDKGVARRVEPGSAFFAVVPSAHRYYLPAESEGWTFFYLILMHAYIARRMIERLKATGPILTLAPAGEVVNAAATLYDGVCRQSFRDEFDWEAAMFDLLLAFERACNQRLYEQPTRDKLLADVRERVLRQIGRSIDIATLADDWRMSRSHFGHYFKATTGLSPARFITDVRLEQVTKLLAGTDEKLETIARQTGFADANHLCKVFRRHLQVSPGEYRRQMR
jgi:AraC-like DNA-binding protein